MKYKGPPMAAIFFMTSFNRDRGGHGTLGPPPGSAAGTKHPKTVLMTVPKLYPSSFFVALLCIVIQMWLLQA